MTSVGKAEAVIFAFEDAIPNVSSCKGECHSPLQSDRFTQNTLQ